MAGEVLSQGPFGWLRNSRYTGERRCLPCTVLNAAFAAVGSVALGVWLAGVTARGLAVAGVTCGFACAVIYTRGYLIPGTPALTERFLPEWVRNRLGKVDEPDAGAGVDSEAVLCGLGIVEEAADGSDLVLDATFEREWIEAVDRFAGTTEELRLELADAIGVEPDALNLERRPHAFDALYEGTAIARWESKPACQADVAAAAILPLFDPDWGRRSFEARSELLGALRLFLDVCPTCRGTVTPDHRVVRSCCAHQDVVAATCEGCRARVFEVAVDLDHLDAESAVPG